MLNIESLEGFSGDKNHVCSCVFIAGGYVGSRRRAHQEAPSDFSRLVGKARYLSCASAMNLSSDYNYILSFVSPSNRTPNVGLIWGPSPTNHNKGHEGNAQVSKVSYSGAQGRL